MYQEDIISMCNIIQLIKNAMGYVDKKDDDLWDLKWQRKKDDV